MIWKCWKSINIQKPLRALSPSRETPEVYTQLSTTHRSVSHYFCSRLLATPFLSKHCALLFISPLSAVKKINNCLLSTHNLFCSFAIRGLLKWHNIKWNNIFLHASLDVSLRLSFHSWSATWKIHFCLRSSDYE